MALKVAIAGFGQEGLAAYRYFKKQGADITILDASAQPKIAVPADAQFISGPNYLADLEGYDKVVRLPAINPRLIHTSAEVTSGTREFLAACPSRNIVGVTASKGKGTICSLIADILQAAGIRVHLAGNIGIPALDILDDVRSDDVVVLELSSFQLWDVTASPHIAVVGMIEPEHLEVHNDFDDYLAAKARVAKYQRADDVVIYHPTNEYSAQIAAQSAGRKVAYNTTDGAYLKDEAIFVGDQRIVATSEVRIAGRHNLENICAALTATWQFTQDAASARAAIKAFKGLPHRLEFVAEVNGVQFYDDSISTTPGSVIAAMNSFAPAHEILIVGGSHDKGADYQDLAHALAEKSPKKVLFVGAMGAKIAAQAKRAGFANGEVHAEWTMPHVVARAAEIATPGDVVVLSPATASFGDFTDYKHRGQQFAASVHSI